MLLLSLPEETVGDGTHGLAWYNRHNSMKDKWRVKDRGGEGRSDREERGVDLDCGLIKDAVVVLVDEQCIARVLQRGLRSFL